MHNLKPTHAGDTPYRVPRDTRRWPALAMALAVHAGLLFFLWIGVHWQSSEPVAVEAEVWDMKIQAAAPPPPPEPAAAPARPTPAPAPPVVAAPVAPAPKVAVPDIALERRKAKERAAQEKQAEQDQRKAEQRAEQEERAKTEAKARAASKAQAAADAKLKALAATKALAQAEAKQEKEASDKKATEKLAESKAKAKRAADEQKSADQARSAEMNRITGAVGSSGTAAKATAPSRDSGYVAAITTKIKNNIAYNGSTAVAGNPSAIYKIEQLPTGEIISIRKTKSSGIPGYDSAVENAISKSSPLPKKKDGTVTREVEAVFNLKDTP